MNHRRLFSGLASCGIFFLLFCCFGTQVCLKYQGSINKALNAQTSRVINKTETNEDTDYFKSGFGERNPENLQKVISAAYAQCVSEEEEGAVLFYNDHSALPLTEGEKRVTLFGHAVAQPLYRGTSAGSYAFNGPYVKTLHDALTDEGFAINETLFEAYKSSSTSRSNNNTGKAFALGEEKPAFYTETLKNSYASDFHDAAIVMLARQGGEGNELRMDIGNGTSQLALQPEEISLLEMIRDAGVFKKTIVLLNSPWAMEVGSLASYGVQACLWIGAPGLKGFTGVAKILTGEVSPSGRLTDTYVASALSAPSCVNGSYHAQTWVNAQEVDDALSDSKFNTSYYDAEEEGIYIGYKYYETRYEDEVLKRYNATGSNGSSFAHAWDYAEEVLYPFGYGLSYTSFQEELLGVSYSDHLYKVKVRVTNTGSAAGKHAVLLYAQTPYGKYEIDNKVEKSAVQFVGFAKTGLLAAGESEETEIDVDEYLLASYDYTALKGYYLSAGDYYLALGSDAHEALNSILAAKGVSGLFDQDGKSVSGDSRLAYHFRKNSLDSVSYRTSSAGKEVTDLFADCDANYWSPGSMTYLSRSDWNGTYPVTPVQLTCTPAMQIVLGGDTYQKPSDAPSVSSFIQGEPANLSLVMMKGLDYSDPMWEKYLNQFSIEELASQVSDSFGTEAVNSAGKPAVSTGDGPDGIGPNDLSDHFDKNKYGDDREVCCYTCQLVLASSFNRDLLHSRGELMGEEAGYMGFMAVWCPGGNLHRTPFGGRNFEYYSEDGTVGYLMAPEEVKGMEERGVHAGMKHLAGNDQELYREGISCFFNEQAFREGPLRSFEGALTKGKGNAHALMQSFNRLGVCWASASYPLCTSLVRGEWGFEGLEETDAIIGSSYRMHFSTTLSAGTDIYCFDFGKASSPYLVKAIQDNDDGYLLSSLRRAVKNNCYCTANSVGVNGLSSSSVIVPVTPWWQILLFCLIGFSAVFSLVFSILFLIGWIKGFKTDMNSKRIISLPSLNLSFWLRIAVFLLSLGGSVLYWSFIARSEGQNSLVTVFLLLGLAAQMSDFFVSEDYKWITGLCSVAFFGSALDFFLVDSVGSLTDFFTGIVMFGNQSQVFFIFLTAGFFLISSLLLIIFNFLPASNPKRSDAKGFTKK
jgi:beta-glucosidase